MMSITEEIRNRLFALQDEKYRAFQAKLMPGVSVDKVIGVRTPELRKLAKEYSRAEGIEAFLSDLPHRYYDENNLHGFIISEWKEYEKTVREINRLLPYIDNWATCDLISPKSFRKHREELLTEIDAWLASDHAYTVRFGIEMLLSHFLDEDFSPAFPEKVAAVKSDEYYINMMIAWYFATALAKQWNAVFPYIRDRRLSPWVHNKTIQKSIESDRITDEQKTILRTFRVK